MNAMYTGRMDIGNHSSRFVWGCLKGNITAIKWSGLHRWARTKHTHCQSHHVRYENGNIREGAVNRGRLETVKVDGLPNVISRDPQGNDTPNGNPSALTERMVTENV